MDGGAWSVRAGFVGGDFLVGEEPEFEAAEEGGQVGDDPVGVAVVVDPHAGADGDAVFLEEGGGVVGVRRRRAAVEGSEGEGAAVVGVTWLLVVVVVVEEDGGGGGEGAKRVIREEELVGEEGDASMHVLSGHWGEEGIAEEWPDFEEMIQTAQIEDREPQNPTKTLYLPSSQFRVYIFVL